MGENYKAAIVASSSRAGDPNALLSGLSRRQAQFLRRTAVCGDAISNGGYPIFGIFRRGLCASVCSSLIFHLLGCY